MGLFDRLFGKNDEEKEPLELRPEKREPLRFRKGDKIQNRHEVKAVLGGGMGVVYIAIDHEWNRVFAIKTFQDKFLWNEDIINRFMEEAETWVNLERHTNILFANFVHKIEGKPFIFLEYIDGGDLSQFIGRMDISQALDFAIQFCTGMDYAYNKLGIIHRDIKPGNVMVARDDRFRFGHAFKVTDFGLVKALGKTYVEGVLESPSISTGMGTWPYMPPEQFPEKIQAKFSFKSMPITTRTDVYSFGVTLYEVLTRGLPFYNPLQDGRIPSETTLNGIFTKSPTSPLRISSQIPERLDGLIMKCLEKNPEDRYQDFEELREELIGIYNDYMGEEYVVIGREEPLTYADWGNKGFSLNNLDRHREAIQCFNKALKNNPTYAEAWNNKGISLHSLGHFEEAIECYNKALAINHGYKKAWNMKGLSLSNLDKFEEALKCFDKALEIDSNFVPAWHNKGNCLSFLGDESGALKCYDKAIVIDTKFFDAWLSKGETLKKLKSFDDAIACYRTAIENFRNVAMDILLNFRISEAYNEKGILLAQRGQFDVAIESLDSAIKIFPKEALESKKTALANVHYQKAVILLREFNQYEEAFKELETSLKIDPEFEPAIKAYKSLQVESPQANDAQGILNFAWGLQNEGKFKEAIEKYHEAIKNAPHEKEMIMLAYLNIGNIFYEKKEFELAIQNYKNAVRINPTHDWPYHNLANAFRDIGKFETAINEYKKAIRINPNAHVYYKNLGLVYVEIGNFDLAAQAIQKAIDISHGADSLNYYNLGVIFFKKGKYQEAIKYFKKFIKIAPQQYASYVEQAKETINQLKRMI